MEGATAEASLDGSKSLSCYTLLLGSSYSHDASSVVGLDRRLCGPAVSVHDPFIAGTSQDDGMFCPIAPKGNAVNGNNSSSLYASNAFQTENILGTSSSVPPQKKKGGWPKGKCRKFTNSQLRPPKPPITGYIAFAKRRREELTAAHPQHSLSFHEVSTRIGHEWSQMSEEQQRSYMQEAARDRERYKMELDAFKRCDTYQLYVRDKNDPVSKSVRVGSPQKCDNKDSVACIDESSELLVCTLCDMYFTNSHNKAVHLQGKEHIAKLHGKLERISGNKPESHCGNSQCLNTSLTSTKLRNEELLNLEEFVSEFISRNAEREMELETLQEHVGSLQAKKAVLTDSLRQIRDRECHLQQQKSNATIALIKSQRQLEQLRSIESNLRSFQSAPVYVFTLSHCLENL